MFTERYQSKLTLQRKAGLYRNPPEVEERRGKHIRIGGREILNFSSNDYLGLGSSQGVGEIVARHFRKYGASSSSSRLVSGNYRVICEAEKAYAEHFGYEDALFFPSGYQANMAVLSTLLEKGDVVLFDKHIHASSVKGMIMSGATFYGYNHSSLSHLEKRLKGEGERQMAVLTESLFSMDGDILDVAALKALKEQYRFLTIIDEAHAFGAIGDGGRGLSRPVADVAIGTFGKAFGLFGAFVLLSKGFKDYLMNFASPLIYTTTLPEAHAAAAFDLLHLVAESDDKRNHLRDVSAFLTTALIREGFRVTGDAHILAMEIGGEEKAAAVSQRLLADGIFVLPARYPTVPRGRAILRISLTALHDERDMALFIQKLKEIYGALEK